jgi:hypothetical protein
VSAVRIRRDDEAGGEEPPDPLAGDRPAERSATLDLLRGYLLFSIIVNHTGRFPNGFDVVTGRGGLWVSAAEGFFFISGLLVWRVRGERMAVDGFGSSARTLLRRAAELYLWAVGTTLAYLFVPDVIGGRVGEVLTPLDMSTGELVRQTLSLRLIYGWADFLTHYAVFMAVAPVALWLLYRRLPVVLLGLSVAVWSASGSNFRMGWQLLFFGGMLCGYWTPRFRAATNRLTGIERAMLGGALAGLAVGTIAINVSLDHFQRFWARSALFTVERLGNYQTALAPRFDKVSLPTGRVLMFALWFGAAYLLVRRFEGPLRRGVGWFLLPLGRRSLFVYLLHGLCIFSVDVFVPYGGGWRRNAAIVAGVLAAVWLAARWVPIGARPLATPRRVGAWGNQP